MTLRHAIGLYIRDAQGDGRINSPNTVRTYTSILDRLADDVGNRDPRTIGREDIKRTLRRWPNPSSQSMCRSVMVAFFDWTVEEGVRNDNPARQTRRPRAKKAERYRLTLDETLAIVNAASGTRELRAIHVGVFAGLRNAELRGLQGRHFQRPRFLWVSADIAKGNRERWIPVLGELETVAAEIREHVAPDEYMLPALRHVGYPARRGNPVERQQALATTPSSSQALNELVRRVAKRAGIQAHIGSHTLRHAFTDYVARSTGDVRIAQALLGHANLATTQTYLGKPLLDELASSLRNRRLGNGPLPQAGGAAMAEPDYEEDERSLTPALASEPNLLAWLESQAPKIALYADHFRGAEAHA